jgi:hypothetical protein
MERFRAFLNKAAKAIVGGSSAGMLAVGVYVQSNPVDFSSWEMYTSGALTAGFTGFVTYWVANMGDEKAQPRDAAGHFTK